MVFKMASIKVSTPILQGSGSNGWGGGVLCTGPKPMKIDKVK